MIFSRKKEKKELFKKAKKEGWAIGAFNFSNLEILKAIFQAAKKLKSPVIVATSEGESRYIGLKQAATIVRVFEKEYMVPAILNLDHGKSFDYIKEAIEAGYDMVHFDGSDLPLKENIEITKKIVALARKKDVLVEGEVGCIKGSSMILQMAPEIKEEDLTDPKESRYFIEGTKIDSLAVSIGNFHGIDVHKEDKYINFKRLEEISNEVGNDVFLVLHGGSGIPTEEIKKAIELGIIKVNVNTELRMAFSETIKKILSQGNKESTPYKYMLEVIDTVQKVVENKIIIFNSQKKLKI
ncbi:ketose-bisphosphate aldolase [Patescibacteria group bacterium]